MNKKRLFIFVLGILLSLALLPGAGMALDAGEDAPGFTLKNLAGEDVTLADFRGRPVLLKLATTWCHTCKELSAELAELGGYLKEQDVVLIEVFVQDSPEMVERYLADKKMPMTYQALLDDGQVYRGYNVYLIPRLLVLDAELKIRFDNGGQPPTAAEIKRQLEQVRPAAATPPAG